MNDRKRTKEQLIEELVELRQRVMTGQRALPESGTAAALLQVAPLGIHECDSDGRITFVSPSQEAITGYTADELVGTYVWDRTPPGASKDSLPAYFRHLVAEQPAPTPYFATNFKKNGQLFDVRVDWNYVRNGQGEVTGFVSIVSDITEEKRREMELREANERLEQRVRERTAELTRANELLTAEVEQRRRAEEELAIFRRFAEASGQGFGMADTEGRITYVNPTLFRWSGEKEPQDCIGKPLSAYMPTDYRQRREKEVLPALLGQGYWQGEEVVVLRHGKTIPTIFTVFPVQDESGKLLRTAIVITDITELKRAEQALRQSHDQLRAIHEGMVDGLVIIDLETRKFVRPNAALCQMLGYSEQEFTSLSLASIHPQEKFPETLAAFHAHADGRLARSEDIPVLRKDGTVFHADIRSNHITYQDRRCLISFIRDVTDRRRAERALAESEAKYRHLVETTDTGFLILDEQGRVVDANDEYVRISGHKALREIVGRSVVEWTAPHDAQRNAREVERCLRQGTIRQLEVDYARDDGTVIPIEINGSVVETSQGRRILSLCRDITDRKRAEEQLKTQQRALHRMILAGDHERRLVTYELHDGVAQQLVGALMHLQAQAPRTGQESKETDAAYGEGIEILRQASSELRRVMSRLRTPVLDRLGLAAAIEDVAAQWRSAPGAPEIEYRQRVTFQRLEPTLENSLFRIAQEAMTNACRYSQSKKVRVSLTQEGDDVTLEVRDWGIGFDQDAVAENRFGLEGIRERARLLGGELGIQSKPGQGTVVQVKFPVIEATDDE